SFADRRDAPGVGARALAARAAGRGAAAESLLHRHAERRRADHRPPAEPRCVHRADHGPRRAPAVVPKSRPRRARLRGIADAILQGRAERSGDRGSRELSCQPDRRSHPMRMLLPFPRSLVLVSALLVSGPLTADVTFERILNADREPHNWLSYSRTLDNQRYSPLEQINVENVSDLEIAWIWQAR